jgi:hypothetical protein
MVTGPAFGGRLLGMRAAGKILNKNAAHRRPNCYRCQQENAIDNIGRAAQGLGGFRRWEKRLARPGLDGRRARVAGG